MEFITGVANKPHVTSMQHRAIFEMIIGKGSYILDKNELLKPELQSNNSLKIRSGMLAHHGGISEVKVNTYDTVTIGNGSQKMKRIDLVVARYEKDPETGVETMDWKVIQGTPAEGTPGVPGHTVGNMQAGDLTDDCPVFQVQLDGIQVTGVKKLLPVLTGSLAEINNRLSVTTTTSNGLTYEKYGDGRMRVYGRIATTGSTSAAVVTLAVPFINMNYTVHATPEYYSPAYPTFQASVQVSSNKSFNVYTRASDGSLLGGVGVYVELKGAWK